MIRKIAITLICLIHVTGNALGSAVPVIETTIIGSTADDYYTGARARLKVIPSSQIGPKVATIPSVPSSMTGMIGGPVAMAGLAFYQKTGQDPVYAAASAIASAADAVFTPAFQAFKANFVSPESYPASAGQYVGVEGSVGATVADIIDFVKNNAADFPLLTGVLDNVSSSPPISQIDPVHPWNNLVFQGANGLFITQTSSTGWPFGSIQGYVPTYSELISRIGGTPIAPFTKDGVNYAIFTGATPRLIAYVQRSAGFWDAYQFGGNLLPYTGDPPPDPSINFQAIKDLFQALPPALAQELALAISRLPINQQIASGALAPSAVPATPAYPINATQVQNFFTNTTQIYNQYNNTVNNPLATPQEIAAGQSASQLAEAQQKEAEQQQEPEPETFAGINITAFGSPYNPGDYDIPKRFSSFLNTVKSSGLFSFSSSFFNSLPGGGSPVYQIAAGQYGSHTIDLSQTMSTGLAVLKTILLACFGFLSIRAVIMKR